MALDTTLPISGTVTDSGGSAIAGAECILVLLIGNDTNSDGYPDEITDSERLARTQTDSNGDFSFTEGDLPTTDQDPYYVAVLAYYIEAGANEPLQNGRFIVLDSSNETDATGYITAYKLTGGEIDAFERTNVDDGRYREALSQSSFSLTTNDVVEGNKALKTDGSKCGIYSLPGDGAPSYPKRGTKFGGALRTGDGSSSQGFAFTYFEWAVPNNPNVYSALVEGYHIYISQTSASASLRKVVGSNITELASADPNFSDKEYVYVDVEHRKNTGPNGFDELFVEFYDDQARTNLITSLGPVEDSEYNINGGYGFRASNEPVRWDNLEVKGTL